MAIQLFISYPKLTLTINKRIITLNEDLSVFNIYRPEIFFKNKLCVIFFAKCISKPTFLNAGLCLKLS